MRATEVRALVVAVIGAVALAACGGGSGATVSGREPDRAAVAAVAAAGPGVNVVAVGDIACPPGRRPTAKACRQWATYRTAAALAPVQVIGLGDEQYEKGSYYGFTHAYARSWGRLRRITWPVPGNHEYYTSGARGYYRYFRYRTPGRPGYYRRTLNGWQLYFLNGNCGVIRCAAERSWLENQMTANPATCSIIVVHQARFSSGRGHGSSRAMKPFWEIAYRHGVDIALSGHDHDYERFAPMTPAGVPDPVKGIRQFVSGVGGRGLYPRGRRVPGSEKFLSTVFGVLQLTLGSATYSWEFHDIHGVVRDSGTGHC